MGQTFVHGIRIPVTKVVAGPCVVTQVKNQDKDGYWSVQLGFSERKIKNLSKPLQGHLKGAIGKTKWAPKFLREVRFEKESDFKVGDRVKASDIFKVGDVVSVTGTSKGKGFAGVVKRWHFAGGPKTHGQSDRQRAPGAIGQGTTPGRVLKGKKMAGRMGPERVTIKNIHVITVDSEKNEVSLSGPVPGKIGSFLLLRKISSGSLKDLETETVVQVVEGEEEKGEEKTGKEAGETQTEQTEEVKAEA